MIALCLMMKDEAAVLPRLIESVKSSVDLVIAMDTGSSDDSIEVLVKCCEENYLGLELAEMDWVDFGYNRSELMEFALTVSRQEPGVNWLLCLDADHTLNGSINERDLDPRVTSYTLRFTGANDHATKRLVRCGPTWEWRGRVHEYLVLPHLSERTAELSWPTITHHHDGASWAGGLTQKWRRYVELLEQDWYDPHISGPGRSRAAFYLGQTHADLQEDDIAAGWYRQAERDSAWDEEKWLAALRASVLEDSMGGVLEAYNMRPSRAESLYHLAVMARKREMYHAALMFAEQGLQVPYPADDVLFIDRWIYDWGLQMEHSVDLWWAGRPHEACQETVKLLSDPVWRGIPPETVTVLEQNLQFMPRI